jgi:hypothetical protein
MSKCRNSLAAARKRFKSRARAVPAIWLVAAFFVLGAAAEARRALSLMKALRLGAKDALDLLVGVESPLGVGSLSGYEVAFLLHAISAVNYLVAFMFLSILALSARAVLRSEALLWNHIDELEAGHKAP